MRKPSSFVLRFKSVESFFALHGGGKHDIPTTRYTRYVGLTDGRSFLYIMNAAKPNGCIVYVRAIWSWCL